jgi:hypothetical protein
MKDELSVSSVLQESEARRTYDRLNKYDESGLTPLMRAVKELDLNQVSSLLGQGADPNIKDGRFGTTTAMDMAIRALGTAATEHERTRLRHIFDALDIAAQRI